MTWRGRDSINKIASAQSSDDKMRCRSLDGVAESHPAHTNFCMGLATGTRRQRHHADAGAGQLTADGMHEGLHGVLTGAVDRLADDVPCVPEIELVTMISPPP